MNHHQLRMCSRWMRQQANNERFCVKDTFDVIERVTATEALWHERAIARACMLEAWATELDGILDSDINPLDAD